MYRIFDIVQEKNNMPLFGNNFLDFFKLAVLQKRWFYELLQDSNLKVVFCVGPDSELSCKLLKI